MRAVLFCCLLDLLCCERPEIRLHGLFAAGLVLLGAEGLLVSTDVRQVLTALGYPLCALLEEAALGLLFGADGRLAVVLANHVDAGAVGVGRFGYAVGSH